MVTNKVLICADQYVVRSGLRSILEEELEFEVVAETRNAMDIISQASFLTPDIIIMDLTLSESEELETVIQLHEVAPQAKLLVLTSRDGEIRIFKALQSGA